MLILNVCSIKDSFEIVTELSFSAEICPGASHEVILTEDEKNENK